MRDKLNLRNRKLLVVFLLVGFMLLALSKFVPGQAFLKVGVLSYFPGFFLFKWSHRLIGRKNLDERELWMRNRVFTAAYQIVMVLASLYVFAMLLGGEQINAFLNETSDLERFSGLVLLPFLIFLPSAIHAWLEPDPITDDLPTSSRYERT